MNLRKFEDGLITIESSTVMAVPTWPSQVRKTSWSWLSRKMFMLKGGDITMGRSVRLKEQMGVITATYAVGQIIGPPAERL
jgi:hypothetical protein